MMVIAVVVVVVVVEVNRDGGGGGGGCGDGGSGSTKVKLREAEGRRRSRGETRRAGIRPKKGKRAIKEAPLSTMGIKHLNMKVFVITLLLACVATAYGGYISSGGWSSGGGGGGSGWLVVKKHTESTNRFEVIRILRSSVHLTDLTDFNASSSKERS
ncbi:hypothetical protein KPH14_009557 [Odynerus spinipes]|uniref:Uncharacterized protein n=1 Tax=Odynerus spinipes TaxID=1348599 RepID=A0AAD9RPS6_9HYME|nr:hypothetical protein KPH14_009557 [Odynerus spinipes]